MVLPAGTGCETLHGAAITNASSPPNNVKSNAFAIRAQWDELRERLPLGQGSNGPTREADIQIIEMNPRKPRRLNRESLPHMRNEPEAGAQAVSGIAWQLPLEESLLVEQSEHKDWDRKRKDRRRNVRTQR